MFVDIYIYIYIHTHICICMFSARRLQAAGEDEWRAHLDELHEACIYIERERDLLHDNSIVYNMYTVCIYTYIYIYIYIHIYMCIYIYTHMFIYMYIYI